MAFSSNPKIIQDGLVLSLDAADYNSYPQLREVEVMVVGGGGGGGMDMGGGGGGGGVVYHPNYKITPNVDVTVTVGAGGWGAPAGSGGYRGDGAGPQPSGHQFTVRATNGGNSAFGSLVALGGGYGGSSYYGYTPDYGIGGTGASGGGNSGYTAGATTTAPQGTVGQGYKGGNAGGGSYYSGGGGGAGGPGVDGPSTPHGGPGIQIPRMSPYYFGGGGGGASYSSGQGGNGGIGGGGGGANGTTYGGAGINNGSPGGGGGGGQWANTPGGNAGANTGGGGGGGAHYNANNQGGNGGSGIVIIRYNGTQAATGGTYSFVNGVSYHTFTSSGTFSPSFNHTTWYDASGKGNHAALNNGITRIPENNGVMELDGSNDYITAPSVNSLGGIPNHAFEIWVKSPGLGSGQSIGGLICPDYGMISYIGGDGNVTYYLYNSSTSSYVSSIGTSGVNIFDNRWHHIVCTRGNDLPAHIYVDGVLKVSSGNTGTWAGTTIWSGMATQIGNNPNNSGYLFYGKIGIAKIYKKYLTAAEILQNFNATRTRFGV